MAIGTDIAGNEAYIVGAVRTPTGRKNGALAAVHPADLGAHVLRALIERTAVDPGEVEDVIFGCLDQLGPQAGDIARTCWLAAGLPDHVPGTTIDRQCGSSQQAVHFAAQAVMSGTQELVVAGGVQSMNQIPLSAAMFAGKAYGSPDPFSGSRGWRERYGAQEVSQFRAAEMIAAKWNISRREMEEFALESNRRALEAGACGYFAREIAPLNGLDRDETPRAGTTLEKMAALEPLIPAGRITAAVSSQIADAAAALLIASAARCAAPRPQGPRPCAPLVGARGRPHLDADRADSGHTARAVTDGDEARRYRSGGDQRSLRTRGARVAAGAQR